MTKNISDFHNNTRQLLLDVTLPDKTSTYQPVPHSEIISHTLEQLDKKGLIVVSENYNIARGGEQVVGCFNILSHDSEMSQRIMFKNSYDKSMSVGFASGGSVIVCSNGMVKGDITFKKVHKGTVLQELRSKIIESVEYLEQHFEKLIQHKDQMKTIEVDKKIIAELTGRMLIESEIINIEQASIIKKEIEFSQHFKFDGTLWNYYNNVTQSLKHSSPANFIKSHADLHQFVEAEFQLD